MPLRSSAPAGSGTKASCRSGSRKGGDVPARLDDEALVREYRRAMCIVLPSVYRTDGDETLVPELLGQTLLEGMACGCPPSAHVASMPEIVEHGVTGFVVPPNDPRAPRGTSAWLRAHPERPRAWGGRAPPCARSLHVAGGRDACHALDAVPSRLATRSTWSRRTLHGHDGTTHPDERVPA